jgi:hypothetical protein
VFTKRSNHVLQESPRFASFDRRPIMVEPQGNTDGVRSQHMRWSSRTRLWKYGLASLALLERVAAHIDAVPFNARLANS